MKARDFLGKVFTRMVVLNLLAMMLVVILLCLGALWGLDIYTHHGQAIVVPQLKGMSYEKALHLLESDGLCMVVSDSGYNKKLPANTILAQTPGYGQKVKEGHVIYVTVNSPNSPTFTIPDVIDNSSIREAEAKLNAIGFRLLPPQQVTGEKDWVYGILCRGRRVSNGDRIPIDFPLTLLVGRGSYDEAEDTEFEASADTQDEYFEESQQNTERPTDH